MKNKVFNLPFGLEALRRAKKMNKKIIKVAIVALILLAVLGGWFWFRNIYTTEILKLEILAPSEAEAGNRITYTVRFKNNGNIRLEDPKLIFEYPETSVPVDGWAEIDDERVTLRGDRKVEILLDELQPGEERSKEFIAVVFGLENATVGATAWLEYKPRNLNVRHYSETSHTLKISGVPLTFEIHLPSRVEPGSEFSFDVNYFSRMEYPLTGLRIKLQYPAEFQLTSSRPRASFENNEWEIGILNRGQGGRIEVSGKIDDSSMTSKTFEAVLGFWQGEKFIPLKNSIRGIELAAPSIFITHQINNRTNYSATPGEYLNYQISFMNTGEDFLENLFLTVKLDESVLDFNTVRPGSGTFQRNLGTLLWDSNGVPELRFLPTMEEGRVDFWVKVKDEIEGTNPIIRADISLSKVNERITTKVNSKIAFAQKGYFATGPFSNYGPQPPAVGSSTSYTIKWQVGNRHNNLENAKVKATLAPGARLSGEISPKDKTVSFDSISREVVWDIGALNAGSSAEVYFQIIFDPASNQKGDSVELVSEAKFSAMDTWTESTIYSGYRGVDTTLPDDPAIDQAMGIIR